MEDDTFCNQVTVQYIYRNSFESWTRRSTQLSCLVCYVSTKKREAVSSQVNAVCLFNAYGVNKTHVKHSRSQLFLNELVSWMFGWKRASSFSCFDSSKPPGFLAPGFKLSTICLIGTFFCRWYKAVVIGQWRSKHTGVKPADCLFKNVSTHNSEARQVYSK